MVNLKTAELFVIGCTKVCGEGNEDTKRQQESKSLERRDFRFWKKELGDERHLNGQETLASCNREYDEVKDDDGKWIDMKEVLFRFEELMSKQ